MSDAALFAANIIAWSAEFFSILFCLHGILGKKIRAGLPIFGILGLDIAVLSLIYSGRLSLFFSGWIHIIIFFYMRKVDKMRWGESIAVYVFSAVVTGAFEIVSSYLMAFVDADTEWDKLIFLWMNLSSFLMSVIFYKITIWKYPVKIFYNRKFIGIIGICGLCTGAAITAYRRSGEFQQISYFLLFILMILIYFFWIQAQRMKIELEKKKLEMELQDTYGNAYKELISEMRRRQHDFMNQLGAIYSMHVTAESLEDLIQKQSRYGDILKEQCRYDKILTGCGNAILAGYLYNKCIGFEKSKIRVDYHICVDHAECRLALHELIEILGILLTNAAESMDDRKVEQVIDLTVLEDTQYLQIKVGNEGPYLTADHARKIFQEGYSSKGENRGLGLARVEQLKKECMAEIIIENSTRMDQNWVFFQVVIPK